ncbi:uncharacterized protein LOC126779020 [Nymphalis io]|uniref:uncharacterized protein LOC126779020 n=1 Tax=Inachis io TaxID=171585 RepID=UPI002169E986|nr:uncharacterized protein LOC126779020 [Nymphalis io]
MTTNGSNIQVETEHIMQSGRSDNFECSGEDGEIRNREMHDNDRRPNKRNREANREEVWFIVQRKGKRFARDGDFNDSERIPEDQIEVCITSTEPIPKQFKLAKILKSENIQNVVRVKYIKTFKVLIQFDKEDSAEKLIINKFFNENRYRTYKTMEINHTYGVIKAIDLDRTDEEILESLYSSIPIMGVKRLKRRNSSDGRWENSEAMRICFKGSSLPSKIKMFDTTVIVTPFVFPVTQCSRCWRYGHTIKICPSNKKNEFES